jgi:hypothetical protein
VHDSLVANEYKMKGVILCSPFMYVIPSPCDLATSLQELCSLDVHGSKLMCYVGGPKPSNCPQDVWLVLCDYWVRKNFTSKQLHLSNAWAYVKNVSKANHIGVVQQEVCIVSGDFLGPFHMLAPIVNCFLLG